MRRSYDVTGPDVNVICGYPSTVLYINSNFSIVLNSKFSWQDFQCKCYCFRFNISLNLPERERDLATTSNSNSRESMEPESNINFCDIYRAQWPRDCVLEAGKD